MPKPVPTLDRDKLRERIRKLGDEYMFYMLDDAIELLSPAQLVKLVGKYIDLSQLQPVTTTVSGRRTLLSDVKHFDARSRTSPRRGSAARPSSAVRSTRPWRRHPSDSGDLEALAGKPAGEARTLTPTHRVTIA